MEIINELILFSNCDMIPDLSVVSRMRVLGNCKELGKEPMSEVNRTMAKFSHLFPLAAGLSLASAIVSCALIHAIS